MSLKMNGSSNARVENSFKQLAAAAQALNSASDDLGKVIRQLDASLKKLALGITAWVQVSTLSDETQYFNSDLGYAKVDGKWGIALREVTGFHLDSEDVSEEIWAFNDGPRALRTSAVDHLPDLLEKMLQQTNETTNDLKAKTAQASELASVVSGLVPSAPASAPQHWNRPAMNALPGGSATGNGKELEGHGAEKPAAPRFREGEQPAGAPPARFREVESLPAERPAPPERPAAATAGRPLPAERVPQA